uniref:Uncharacterized protein n=1 Tax=Rhizophora mucronata TaxID=61149 RepID=A0A2P2PNQ9_RHIMU
MSYTMMIAFPIPINPTHP